MIISPWVYRGFYRFYIFYSINLILYLITPIIQNRPGTIASQFQSKNLLDILFELINVNKCTQVVIDFVMNMVFNFVSFADFVEEVQEVEKQELQQNAIDNGFFNLMNTKPLPFDVELIKEPLNVALLKMRSTDEVNFGTVMLQPHVETIVDHIERIVTENLAKKNLPSKPLKILAR